MHPMPGPERTMTANADMGTPRLQERSLVSGRVLLRGGKDGGDSLVRCPDVCDRPADHSGRS